jgi:hypothetical protein
VIQRSFGARIADGGMNQKYTKDSEIADRQMELHSNHLIGTAQTGKGGGRMTDDERVLLIGIFMAVFLTFAIAVFFCME